MVDAFVGMLLALLPVVLFLAHLLGPLLLELGIAVRTFCLELLSLL